jgi:hypothetical protein
MESALCRGKRLEGEVGRTSNGSRESVERDCTRQEVPEKEARRRDTRGLNHSRSRGGKPRVVVHGAWRWKEEEDFVSFSGGAQVRPRSEGQIAFRVEREGWAGDEEFIYRMIRGDGEGEGEEGEGYRIWQKRRRMKKKKKDDDDRGRMIYPGR